MSHLLRLIKAKTVTRRCMHYWPKDINGECKHGGVLIKYVGIKETFDYNIRSLEITKTRRLNQFHFKSWPDIDVPDTTWCLVDFWRAVAKRNDTNTSTILVHCSGMFIALDNLIAQARIENCVRPLQVVEALRQQRVNMVQTKTFKQFYVPGTNEDPDRQSILDLIEAILAWQGQLSTDTPILIKDG
ncbi:hypothetical protein DPMN_058514 [Dreissena polymorpha]|uniref:protein-tyrosine-phosphatase n=1 Tax=Dreissena polymorpha TaxID=45954 RepID=A0A9D4C266_DREPO|nr:hypothetical protein DPMN_058514 [Dreissena polymorpha]